ncbi:MAG: TolC family protein [Candidatus Azobacteroides sp.]|nr:TolC family protein [Candidatus Azobacteroides sp.]
MKTKIITALFFVSGLSLFGQQPATIRLSLNDCIQTAVEKNINAVQARMDKQKGRYKIEEARSALLPKITGSGTFQDNLKLPVTMIPGDILGQPGIIIPFEMGVQYNTGISVGVNQILYNQTALTGLKLSKMNDQLNSLGIEKVNENLAQETADLYFLAQTTAEQERIVKDNIARTEKMVSITKTLWDNGMGKKVDYDRIKVMLENQQTNLDNTSSLLEQQLNMIKYLLEIPVSQSIQLTDSVDMPLLPANPGPMVDFSDHIDIQIIEQQKEIASLNQKMVNQGYLPSLSFIGNLSYQGQRSELKNYFNNSPENSWFTAAYIGLNLSIPIFDGFEKRSKSRQAKIDYQKTILTLDNTKEKFSADYKNALNNYYNYKNNVKRQEENIELAQNVYKETALKYREGMASMSDLLQDETGLSNAQINYLNALYNFKSSELEIMMLNGEIRRLIQ